MEYMQGENLLPDLNKHDQQYAEPKKTSSYVPKHLEHKGLCELFHLKDCAKHEYVMFPTLSSSHMSASRRSKCRVTCLINAPEMRYYFSQCS